MSFLSKLMQEAQPKKATINKAVANVFTNAINSKAGKVASTLGHKALVNTVGLAAAYAEPVITKAWAKVEAIAAEPAAEAK